MLNIQWLKLFTFILLTMPGAFIYIFKKIRFFKYKSFGSIYLYVLLAFELILGILLKRPLGILSMVVIILGVGIPVLLELKSWRLADVYQRIIRVIGKNESLFIFPILEELHFRWLIYTVGQLLAITPFAFVLISGLSFGVSHIPYLGSKSIPKTIQGFLLAILFLNMGLMTSIVCHMMFNIFVYVYRVTSRGQNTF